MTIVATIGSGSGTIGPTIPTSFVTDSGTAVPALNILNVLGGTNARVTGSGNTVTISAITQGQVVNVTTPGAYPYTTLTTDYVIKVDTTSARTIIPMASPVTGQTYRIKDANGAAATNNITITPSGKNIDGAASLVININFGSADIVYTGTQWSVM